jgi:ATP-dependent RNA helicase DDX3X
MADQLNMNNLSLGESQHAPQQNGNGNGFVRSAYIPPHARGSAGGPAPGGREHDFDGAHHMNGNGFAGPK